MYNNYILSILRHIKVYVQHGRTTAMNANRSMQDILVPGTWCRLQPYFVGRTTDSATACKAPICFQKESALVIQRNELLPNICTSLVHIFA